MWEEDGRNRSRIKDTRMTGSQQVSPLGWNILDTKRTVGGLFGYSSVNCIVNLKVPSSNGVSFGLCSEGNVHQQ